MEFRDANISNLWNFLYEKGIEFIASNSDMIISKPKIQLHSFRFNSELAKGCPGSQSFLKAVQKLNLNVNDPQSIHHQGVWGWHGTRTEEAVTSIARYNLDPCRRNNQQYGPGEYCAVDPSYSKNIGRNTKTLLLFFILKSKYCNYISEEKFYVVNNPSPSEMYMVPILFVSFN